MLQKGFIFLKHNKKCENKNFEQAKKSLHKFKVKQATSSSTDKSVKLDASYNRKWRCFASCRIYTSIKKVNNHENIIPNRNPLNHEIIVKKKTSFTPKKTISSRSVNLKGADQGPI